MNQPDGDNGAATNGSTSTLCTSVTSPKKMEAPQQQAKVAFVAKRSNPSDLLKNLKSVDKKNLKKPTILEQAAQDWNKCKAQENLEDELKQATKSKTGYLDRQRFLERADLRLFEKEREIRDRVRSRASLNRDN